MTSTREHRHCPDYPVPNKGECPVEFVYVWPQKNEDKHRWLSGIVRQGGKESNNLHNHPLHNATKIPLKVVHDIHEALEREETLKTHEIMTG